MLSQVTQPQVYTQMLASFYPYQQYRINEMMGLFTNNNGGQYNPHAASNIQDITPLATGGLSIHKGLRRKRNNNDAVDVGPMACGTQISPTHLAFIEAYIEKQTVDELKTFLDEITNPGLEFSHATSTLVPHYEETMEHEYTEYSRGWIRYQNKFGFALSILQPDPEMVRIPCILNPLSYSVWFARNQYNKLVWTVYDMNGEVRDDIFVDCMYEPQSNGQLTSPMFYLIDAFISYVTLRATLEQVNAQQVFHNLILEDHSPPALWQDSDPDRPFLNARDLPRDAGFFNLGAPGNLALMGTTPLTSNNNANPLLNATNMGGPLTSKLIKVLELLARNRSQAGEIVNTESMTMKLINDVVDAALKTRPPTPNNPHAVYVVSDGWVLRPMPPPQPPHHYVELIDDYRWELRRVFGLPPSEDSMGPRQMFKDERQLMERRRQKAVYNCAFNLERLLKKTLAHVYGRLDQIYNIMQQLYAASPTGPLRLTSTSDMDDQEEEDDEEDGGGAGLIRLMESGEVRSRKRGRQQQDIRPAAAHPVRKSKKVRALELEEAQLILANRILKSHTIPLEGEDEEDGMPSSSSVQQAQSRVTAGTSELEQDQEGMQGDPHASSKSNRDPEGAMRQMAEHLEEYRRRAEVQKHVSQGKFTRAFVEDERTKLMELFEFTQVAKQRMDNGAGLTVRLRFLINYERADFAEKESTPEGNMEMMQELLERFQHAQHQMQLADYVMSEKQKRELQLLHQQNPSPATMNAAARSLQTPKDVFQSIQQVLTSDQQYDPLVMARSQMVTQDAIGRLDPRPRLESRLTAGTGVSPVPAK